MLVILCLLALVGIGYFALTKIEAAERKAMFSRKELMDLADRHKILIEEKVALSSELINEKSKYQETISQKKSSETRLGQVTEHLVPFLENCRHDPKNMHFLGQPIDYIVVDFDQGEITFLEVKTGNAKESHRQKTIKNIIKSGKVFYETMRINAKGVTTKKQENEV